jgi:hypothetical protein
MRSEVRSTNRVIRRVITNSMIRTSYLRPHTSVSIKNPPSFEDGQAMVLRSDKLY